MMKEKLLFISRKWPPAVGGMETYAVELCRSLGEVSDLEVIALKGRADGSPPSLLRYAIFLLRVTAFCLTKGHKFDRVIFGDLILFPAAIAHWARNRRARRLVILYGLDLVYQQRNGILPALYGFYLRAFKIFQHCFCQTIAISRYTASLATRENIRNVSTINPCLPTRSDPAPSNLDYPPQWPRRQEIRKVLYFGRLIPRKGSLWFAQEVLPKITHNTEFFVAGDSSNKAYKDALRQCERTHLLGRVNDSQLSAMIRSADVVVMPNIPTADKLDAEGFGLVAVETSSLGGLLIASSIDGITDAVSHGVTGTLANPLDSEQWASLIQQIFEMDEETISSKRSQASTETRRIYSSESQALAFMEALSLRSEYPNEGITNP